MWRFPASFDAVQGGAPRWWCEAFVEFVFVLGGFPYLSPTMAAMAGTEDLLTAEEHEQLASDIVSILNEAPSAMEFSRYVTTPTMPRPSTAVLGLTVSPVTL